MTSAASAAAAKTTLPVRSIAEEAAAKAKQVHLQSLRDKVYGKGNTAASASSSSSPSSSTTTSATTANTKDPGAGAGDATSSSSQPQQQQQQQQEDTKTVVAAAGLQSPTSSGWKVPPGGAPAPIQSPTSTSWKPRDVDPPVTELHGATLARASADDIAAVERAETIREEGEGKEKREEEEDDDDDDDDDDDGRVTSHTIDLADFFQNAKPSIVIFGTYQSDNLSFDIIVAVTGLEKIVVPGQQNGSSSIVLSENNSAVVLFNPEYWFGSLTTSDLEAGVLQVYQDRRVLFVHKDFNRTLYEKLVPRLQESVAFNIASDH